MKSSQYDRIGALIKRKKGATAADLIAATMSTSIHSRLSEMKRAGWQIWRESIPGKNYGRYFGEAPRAA